MPKKVLPSEEDFAWLERELIRLGFRSISRTEVGKSIKRLSLFPPRPRPGREAGFSFSANGLTVYVWTTWLREEGGAREEDSGWVLIAKDDEVPYFNHPTHRTKNYVRNLARQAWIARWRVLHRPLCEKCNQYMDIVRGKGLKSRYWRCDRITLHEDGKPSRLSWDHELPPKAKQHVIAIRKKRARGKKAPTVPSMLQRKTWHRANKSSA